MQVLRNTMEVVILNELDALIADSDICKCDICKLDVAALVLNSVPPKYSVTESGEVYTRAQMQALQVRIDIFKEVAKAIDVVKSSPRHTRAF